MTRSPKIILKKIKPFRWLTVTVCAALLAAVGLAAYAASPPADGRGDVDHNGSIDTTDARLVLQYVVGKGTYDARMDVNLNGNADTTDARLILQYIVGKITAFPNGTVSTADNTGISDTSASTTDNVTTADTAVFTSTAASSATTVTSATATTETGPTTPFVYPARDSVIAMSSTETRYIGKAYLPGTEFNDTAALDQGMIGEFLLPVADNPALPYNVQFYVSKSKHEITALIPACADMRYLKPTFTSPTGSTVTMETASGAAVRSGDVMDFTNPFNLVITTGNTIISMNVNLEALNTGLPYFCLDTNDLSQITSKDTYWQSTFTFGGGDKSVCPYAGYAPQMNLTGEAKGHGNTSWGEPKKPYTIKFDNKTSIFDLPASKNWVLVANYEDKSLLRNKLGEDYLAGLDGMDAVMKVRPVDLFYNGAYWGTYNLTEKVEIETNRLNITDYTVGMAPSQCGYLLEFDNHTVEHAGGNLDSYLLNIPGCTVYYNPNTDELFFPCGIGGKYVAIHKPSYLTYLQYDAAPIKYIYDKVTAAANALLNQDWTQISSLMDVDSFIKWYMIEEWMDNTDSSMHSSVFMYLAPGGKLTLGPTWDFDRSCGNCDYWYHPTTPDLYNSGAGWFKPLFQNQQARDRLKALWVDFYNKTANLTSVIDGYAAMMSKSANMNFKRWDILNVKVANNPQGVVDANTYPLQIAYLENWLVDRREALNSFYNSLT